MENTIYIPEQFVQNVVLHVEKLYNPLYTCTTPLFLCIHGPTGVGKTYQCLEIFKRYKYQLFQLEKFEDKFADVPRQSISDKIDEAEKHYIKTRQKSVIFIDDGDLAIGVFESTTYTVNTQHIIQLFMRLANRPTVGVTWRIPIIITCNDMTRLYEPLQRPERMTTYKYNPNDDTTAFKKIIENIFDVFTVEQVSRIIEHLNNYASEIGLEYPSIAFYADLRTRVTDEKLMYHYSIDKQLPVYPIKYSFDECIQSGKIRLDELKAVQTCHMGRNRIG